MRVKYFIHVFKGANSFSKPISEITVQFDKSREWSSLNIGTK